MSGRILLVSGPSGSGKSTLLSRLMDEFSDVCFSVSSTTRAPRDGEKNGVDYVFTSEDEFKKGIDEGKFLEWARVHNNFYGTSLEQIENAVNSDKNVILDIDVQGRDQAMKICPELITSVFVAVKDEGELAKRLKKRASDDAAAIEKRLLNAKTEIKRAADYDYLIINDDLNRSYECLRAIYTAMRLKNDVAELSIGWNI